VTDGAIVTAYQGVALTTVQQLDPIYVDVVQSSNEQLAFQRKFHNSELTKNGDDASKVQLVLSDGTTYPYEGVLQFRDVSVDHTTSSVTLRIVFPNPYAELLPGMFVNAVVSEGIKNNALLLPQQAVSRDSKGNPTVKILRDNGQVEDVIIKLDRTIGANWLVSDGIKVGDRVVVEGLQRLGVSTQNAEFLITEYKM